MDAAGRVSAASMAAPAEVDPDDLLQRTGWVIADLIKALDACVTGGRPRAAFERELREAGAAAKRVCGHIFRQVRFSQPGESPC